MSSHRRAVVITPRTLHSSAHRMLHPCSHGCAQVHACGVGALDLGICGLESSFAALRVQRAMAETCAHPVDAVRRGRRHHACVHSVGAHPGPNLSQPCAVLAMWAVHPLHQYARPSVLREASNSCTASLSRVCLQANAALHSRRLGRIPEPP